jgi:predicted outer membrane protein
MSKLIQTKLLAVLAVLGLMVSPIVGQSQQQSPSPQQPRDGQPGIQVPREGQPSGEEKEQEGRQGLQRPDASEASQALDTHLVLWLSTDNQAQITLSQLAAEKAKNEKVKQFAQKMVTEHEQCHQKLHEIVQAERQGQDRVREGRLGEGRRRQGLSGQAQNARPDRLRQQRSGQDRTERREVRQTGSAAVANQLTTIRNEVCERNLQAALDELQNKEGADFDKCYMYLQTAAHLSMVNSINVFQQHTSGELQSALQEAGSKMEKHLKESKELAEMIDSDDDDSDSNKAATADAASNDAAADNSDSEDTDTDDDE